MPFDDSELLHKVEQTSNRLQCSPRHTRKLIDTGELEIVRLGRAVRVIVASENAYLERLRQREGARRIAKAESKARLLEDKASSAIPVP